MVNNWKYSIPRSGEIRLGTTVSRSRRIKLVFQASVNDVPVDSERCERCGNHISTILKNVLVIKSGADLKLELNEISVSKISRRPAD